MQNDKRDESEANQAIVAMENNDVTASYSKLIRVIEFFSQRFSLENMTRYMYDFVLELFQPTLCTMITLENDYYHLYDSINTFSAPIRIKKEEKHDQLVYFHPGLLDREFLSDFLDDNIIKMIHPEIGIPIIIDKTLYSIIFIGKDHPLSKDDLIIAEALMNIYHLALTNLKNYNNLERVKRELDEKIFNLFAINQASKALLSEQDPNKLMHLSLSVFSELTQSRITSIFLRDPLDFSYQLIDYNDVFNPKANKSMKLEPIDPKKINVSTIVDWSNSIELERFKENFTSDFHQIELFEPKYIVNFNNNGDLIGFVTMSNRVTGDNYDRGVFELLESLASATYVAISNANNYFEVLKHQRIAEQKFSRISMLNRLIKNMNTSSSLENLVELTLETLKVAFGYKTCFYASYEDPMFKMIQGINIDWVENEFRLEEIYWELTQGKMVIKYDYNDVIDVLGGIFSEDNLMDIQGLMMIPVCLEDVESPLLGVIALLDVEEGALSTDENMVTLETISNLIAPIIRQFNVIDDVKKNYMHDDKSRFITYVQSMFDEAEMSNSEVFIVLVQEEKRLFDETVHDHIEDEGHHVFRLDRHNNAYVTCSYRSAMEIHNQFSEQKVFQICFPKDVDTMDALKDTIETLLCD